LRELGGAASARVLPYRRGDGKRCAVCLVDKRAVTPERYPRREGIPQRRPL
jgi:hypothetical protein